MKKLATILFLIFTVLMITGIVCSADVPFNVGTYYKNDTFEQYRDLSSLPTTLNQTSSKNPMWINQCQQGYTATKYVMPFYTTGIDGKETVAVNWHASSGTINLYPGISGADSDIIVFEMKLKLNSIINTSSSTLGAMYFTVSYEGGTQELFRITPKQVNLDTDEGDGNVTKTYRADVTFFYVQTAGMNERWGHKVSDAMNMGEWYDIKIVLDSTDHEQLKCAGAYINGVLVPGTKGKELDATKGSLKTATNTRVYSNNSNFEMHIDDIKIYSPIYKKYVVNSVECGSENEIKAGSVITGVNLTKYRSDDKADNLYFAVYNELGDICYVRSIKGIQNSVSGDSTTLNFTTPITVDGSMGEKFTSKTFIWEDTQFPVINTFNFNKHNPTIFLAGDSTCQYVAPERLPYDGWGSYLGQYFTNGAKVNNQAKGGYGTKTYIKDKYLDNIFTYAKRGDFLFIQFGINDSNPNASCYVTIDEYKTNLKTFIDKARANGVIPVIITSTLMHSEVSQPEKSIVYPYRDAAIEFAQANNVAYLDTAEANHNLVVAWNEYPDGYNEGSTSGGGKQLFWWTPAGTNPSSATAGRFDKVHLSMYGSAEYAKILVNAIKNSDDADLKNLATFIDPTKDLSQGIPLEVYPW